MTVADSEPQACLGAFCQPPGAGRAAGCWEEIRLIVGIAKNAKYIFVAEPPSDFIYLPYRQKPQQRMIMVAQSAGDPASLVGPLREVVHELDPNLPIFNVRTMEEFYQHLQPFAGPFMAGAGARSTALPFGALPFLSGGDGGPHRSPAHPIS